MAGAPAMRAKCRSIGCEGGLGVRHDDGTLALGGLVISHSHKRVHVLLQLQMHGGFQSGKRRWSCMPVEGGGFRTMQHADACTACTADRLVCYPECLHVQLTCMLPDMVYHPKKPFTVHKTNKSDPWRRQGAL
eukprot:365810-Chlamydomonas_euryale.AAC.32